MDIASIGIIGGADGPTAVFITGEPWGLLIAALGLAAAAALLIYLKNKK